MKNAKNPTRRQKLILESNRLNPNNWQVIKVVHNQMYIINRRTNKLRTISMGE